MLARLARVPGLGQGSPGAAAAAHNVVPECNEGLSALPGCAADGNVNEAAFERLHLVRWQRQSTSKAAVRCEMAASSPRRRHRVGAGSGRKL